MSAGGTDLVLYEPGAVVPAHVVDVTSGEIISMSAPSDDLIALRMRLKRLAADLRSVNKAIDDEIKRRMDHDLRWTIDAPAVGAKATAPSPEKRLTVPDPAALNRVLQQMLDEELITPAAKMAAIEPEPVAYKTKLAGIKALMKRDDLAPRLQTVVILADPDRHVTYK